MKWMLQSTIALLVLSVAAISVAQDDDGADAPPQETVYDFEGDTVEGALLRPEGDLMSGQRHGKESSLIDIRADFIPEMIRSVHEQ